MYLADSICFEPSISRQVFPNKKTTFLITFSPKSVQVLTFEYFTIFSVDDEDGEIDEKFDNIKHESYNKTVQMVTVCVQGSCFGNILE